jgi:fermentation-respiration switch protein FrsA (DUF1100 family)
LLVLENKLVYVGSKYPRGNWNPTEFPFEEVTYAAADGTRLVSWLLEPVDGKHLAGPRSDEQKVVLLFHGNAENVAQSARRMGVPLRDCLNAVVLVAEYRGYGKSEGEPYESGILQDADAAMNWLSDRTGKSPDEIIVVGHSLGGGPACYIAGNQGCRALILDRTFDSLASAAQWNYPMFPVKFMMRNRFQSDTWIKQFTGPVFISHGDSDTLIPLQCAERLHEAAAGEKKKLHLIRDWGHWDAFPIDYWAELAEFCELE